MLFLFYLLSFSLQTCVNAALSGCSNSSLCTCHDGQLACRGLSDLSQLPAGRAARRLQLRDCRLPRLDAGQLRGMPALRSLEVVNCSVETVTGAWRQTALTHLSLAQNRLTEFRLSWLDGLSALRTLNLSDNPLRTLTDHQPLSQEITALDLSGGRWNCTDRALGWLHGWSLGPDHRVASEEETHCSETRKQYRTMDGLPLLEVLRLTQEMLERCPSAPPFSCWCDLVQVGGSADRLTPVIVEVYCDDRRLRRYPPALPANTTALYMRNNSVTGFGPVIGNRTDYQALTALYLDGNQLSAEDANLLEGSDFIHRFSILSLSRNQLQTLPLYAFDNAFKKRSFNVDSLFLGGNPWLCDCDSPFTFTFQTWLALQHKLIRDHTDIRCGSGRLAEGTPPPGRPVLALSKQKLCGGIRVNWWDVTIGVLALLLTLLVCKFAYDVTLYRRTGKLPLVARKFPC